MVFLQKIILSVFQRMSMNFGFIALMYTLLAAKFSVGKFGMGYGPPTLFIAVRMVISSLPLLGYAFFTNKPSLKVHKEDAGLFLKAAIFGVFLTFVPTVWALKYTSAAKVAFLYALAPFFTFFIEYLRKESALTFNRIAGLCIGFAGMLLMFTNNTVAEEAVGHFGFISLPEIAMLVAVISYSYKWFLVKDLTQKRHYTSFAANGWMMFIGSIMTILVSIAYDSGWSLHFPVSNWPYFILSGALIATMGVTSYLLYTELLRHYSPTLISFAGLLQPVIGATFDWLMYGDVVTWTFFLSTGIISVGLYVFYRDELQYA